MGRGTGGPRRAVLRRRHGLQGGRHRRPRAAGGMGARRRRRRRAGGRRRPRLCGGRHVRGGPRTCHDQVRLVARDGPEGEGDWVVAVLSRLPIRSAEVVPVGPQLRRDPGRRAVVRAVVDVGGAPFTVVGTHMPLLKDPVWRLAPALRATLPGPDAPGALAGDMNMWGWCADRLAGPGWRRAVRGRTYPGPSAAQPDRPHPRERRRHGRVVRGGAPGDVRPPTGPRPPPLLTPCPTRRRPRWAP